MVCFFCNSFVIVSDRKTNANIIFLYSAREDNDQSKLGNIYISTPSQRQVTTPQNHYAIFLDTHTSWQQIANYPLQSSYSTEWMHTRHLMTTWKFPPIGLNSRLLRKMISSYQQANKATMFIKTTRRLFDQRNCGNPALQPPSQHSSTNRASLYNIIHPHGLYYLVPSPSWLSLLYYN